MSLAVQSEPGWDLARRLFTSFEQLTAESLALLGADGPTQPFQTPFDASRCVKERRSGFRPAPNLVEPRHFAVTCLLDLNSCLSA